MLLVTIPFECSCGVFFEADCVAVPTQTQVGYHSVDCPSCLERREVPGHPVRIKTTRTGEESR